MPISEANSQPVLRLERITGGYGNVHVLQDVDLTVQAGEVVALMGPNGAGKSTLLRVVSGLLKRSSGKVLLSNVELEPGNPRDADRRGVAHVIEGHRVFTELSVYDNLLLAAYGMPRSERSERVEEALAIFPEIAAKRNDRGGSLSGGQQQMLAVAQGIVKRPKLLMLDEPSAGLSPVLVDRVLEVVQRLKQSGVAVLLVEQIIEKTLAVSDRVYSLAQGRIVLESPADAPGLVERLEKAYFGMVA